MDSATVALIFNSALASVLIVSSIMNKWKQNQASKIITPTEFRKLAKQVETISKFVEEELIEEELTPEELEAQQQEQIKQLMPLVEMIGENVFMRFQRSKAGMTRVLNANERKLNEALFMDSLDNMPGGDLIKMGVENGIIGRETLKFIEKNPLAIDIIMAKFGPQLMALQEKLTNQMQQATQGSNGSNGSYENPLSFLT